MIKWKLLVTTLPYVLGAIAAKVAVERVLHFEGVVDFGDMGLVLTGGIFLIGFMLAGTMSDYKESEKLPAEIACALETIEETLDLAATSKPALDGAALKRSCFDVTTAFRGFLARKVDSAALHVTLAALAGQSKLLDKAGATPLAVRVLAEVHGLRKAILRVNVISRTNFLATGYALMDTLVALVLLLLMIAKFKSAVAEYMLIAFVTLIYVYMVRLIRDIDDPFEYSDDGAVGAAEIDLFPLDEYKERAEKRLASPPAA